MFTSPSWSIHRPLIQPLSLQLTHLGLSILWNVAGVILLSQGLPALGPTTSLASVPLMLVVAVALLVGARQLPVLYVTASGLAGLVAAFTIFGGLTKDPALWPAEGWRYGGILINAVGVTGALWGIKRLLFI